MVHLEDILDPIQSIRSVGVPTLRSDRHPDALRGTVGSVEADTPMRSKSSKKLLKRKVKFLSTDSESGLSITEKSHKKCLPGSQPIEISDLEKIRSSSRSTRVRRPSKRLVESVCAAARVGMNSGSHKVGLTSRERSQLIDQYGQSKGEGIIDLFVGHLHTIKSKDLQEVYIPKGIKKALSSEDKDLW